MWEAAKREPAKYGALVTLIFQNSALVLLMRSSQVGANDGRARYLTTTAVVCMEALKLIASLAILVVTQGSFGRVGSLLYTEIFLNMGGTLAMAVPSLLYVIQNNLLYIAVANLEPGTYQVTYQLKILTTVLFSMLMFGTKISSVKATSLGLLIIGVALVQTAALPPSSGSGSGSPANGEGGGVEEVPQRPLLGLGMVICACFTSGFAGVYFEKILKGRQGKASSAPWSIWIKNIQFAIFGILMGLVAVVSRDGDRVYAGGFFQGYSPTVLGVIFFQGLGGLTVAVIVKYADSIVKGYAASVSIVVSSSLSIWLFGSIPSTQFVFGALCVIIAVYLYSLPSSSLPPSSHPTVLPTHGKPRN